MLTSFKSLLQGNLNLIEIFASVQGETTFSGLPTTFIRLAACNLRCSWCDTKYSFGRGIPYSLEAILTKVEEFSCKNVCITGGEPLLQNNVHILMSHLCSMKYVVSLETSGSLSIAQVDSRVHTILDIKCPDSGMSEKNLWSNLDILRPQDEVKFVINSFSDYQYAKKISMDYKLFAKAKQVLFSPVHGVLDPKLLVEWILRDKLPVRLNLQIHKHIWTPETKGV